MNENLNLVEILKDCPKGTKLYSIAHGDVEFEEIAGSEYYPICIKVYGKCSEVFTADGKLFNGNGECILFPNKDQRDWSKFTAPWLKKERFDPKTLQPYDRVLVRDTNVGCWKCTFYSHKKEYEHCICKYATAGSDYKYCIPYNDDTKYLVNTTDEAPEYYRYWED